MIFYRGERLAIFALLCCLVGLLLSVGATRRAWLFRDFSNGEQAGGPEVFIAGAVNKPGWYRVRGETGLWEAAAKASLRHDADPRRIDARVPLTGGQVLYVPRAGQGLESVENEREELLTGLRRPAQLVRIDLNSAGRHDLAALPGLGDKLAEAIILERSRVPFQNVSELRRVAGIGEKKLKSVEDYLTVGKNWTP